MRVSRRKTVCTLFVANRIVRHTHTKWRNDSARNRASNMHCLRATSTKHIFFLFVFLVLRDCMICVHKLLNRCWPYLEGGKSCTRRPFCSPPHESCDVQYLEANVPYYYCITRMRCTMHWWCFSFCHHCFHFSFLLFLFTIFCQVFAAASPVLVLLSYLLLVQFIMWSGRPMHIS